MENKNKYVNLSYLNEISNGNKDFIIELIDMFFLQVPEYQNLLQDYLKKKDWHNLGRTAHKAKSSILMMGMDDLSRDLKNLEENTKEAKNISEYSEIIAKFVRGSNAAIKELEEIRKKI